MFLMKDKIVLFIAGCFTLILFSCLGNGESYDYELSKDAQVYQFHLKSDSVPKLDSVKFTIDQLNGEIYNIDSMPFGTVLKNKVICTFQTKAVIGIQVIQEALINPEDASKDTIWWNASDSLDFSKPVKFITYAMDGVTKKTYTAKVNIHKVVPDSMVWEEYKRNFINHSFSEQTVIPNADTTIYTMYAKTGSTYSRYTASADAPLNWLAGSLNGFPENALLQQMVRFKDVLVVPAANGKLFQSVDGEDWTPVVSMDHYSVVSVLGVVPAEDPVLSLIVNYNGKHCYLALGDLIKIPKAPGDVVDGTFPISDFGRFSYKEYRGNLSLVAGTTQNAQVSNTVWSTKDGLHWIELTNGNAVFPARTGAMVTPYDGKYYMIGGLDNSDKALKDIYLSSDYGQNWSKVDSLKILPDNYKARAFSSVQVNKENYLFLIGGKEIRNSDCLNQIWRGRINRLGFVNQKK